MMLVRLDPNSSTINVLSVPRDLEVQHPEGGRSGPRSSTPPTRSAAPNLLIKTLQQQVFPGLKVNHIVDVNFGGFEDLVDAIGCVYTDVDHRYYNNTALHRLLEHRHPARLPEAVRTPTRWRSCASATPTPTSCATRASRTSSAGRRIQFSQNQIIQDKDTLLKIFGEHAQTDHDLHTTDGLINLFDLVAFSAGHTIKQIPFPAILLPCAPVAPTATARSADRRATSSPSRAPSSSAFHAFMSQPRVSPRPRRGPSAARANRRRQARRRRRAAAARRG